MPSQPLNALPPAAAITDETLFYVVQSDGAPGLSSRKLTGAQLRAAISLGGLSDVNVASPDAGDVLTWDDGAQKWVAAVPAGGGAGGDVPNGGTTGEVLRKASNLDQDVEWASLLWPVAPAYRTSAIQSSSASSFTVNFPVTSAAGDRAIIFCGGGFSFTRPAGWEELDNQAGTNFNGAIFTRVLSSSDISTGSVGISATGSFNAVLGIIVFNGAPEVGKPAIGERSSSGATSDTLNTDGSPTTNDLVVLWGSNRGTSTNTCSLGTQRAQLNATNASGVLSTVTPASNGGISPVFSYSTAGSGYYEAAVTLKGF